LFPEKSDGVNRIGFGWTKFPKRGETIIGKSVAKRAQENGRSFRHSHLICFTRLICGVICVPVRLKAIEGASVVTVEGKSQLDPLG
jgi:hypothetical protein